MAARTLPWLAGAALLLAPLGCSDAPATPAAPSDPCQLTEAPIPEPELYTPRWAFEPWISKDISDAQDTRGFVSGFLECDIPVGVVVFDSPWETNYHTFVADPGRYPHFDRLVAELHAQGIRSVVWMTQMLNAQSFDAELGGTVYDGPSPNYAEAEGCGFFVDEAELYPWWKGKGSAIDFHHPRAMAWWHRQQLELLERVAIDGYKLDFGDEYVRSDPVLTAAGPVPHQEYSEAYYRDFLAFGQARRGREFLTMVRPYDRSYGRPGRLFARPEHAPVAWVGDNRRDWVGLSDALDHVFRSVEAGYVMLGSDLGGYLDRDDEDLLGPKIEFDAENFARWTALSALMPFMQLHGRANLEPWAVPEQPEEIVRLYRYWAQLHHQLVPFFYSLTREAHAGRGAVLRPLRAADEAAGDYRFQVGEALLVAPLLDATGRREVQLPAGKDYLDWWTLGAPALAGGATLAATSRLPRERVPLYLIEGAILPLVVDGSATGLGSAATADAWTIVGYPGRTPTSFTLYETDDGSTQLRLSATGFEAQRLRRRLRLRVRLEQAPREVVVNGRASVAHADLAAADAQRTGHVYDPTTRSLWVLTPTAGGPLEVRWR